MISNIEPGKRKKRNYRWLIWPLLALLAFGVGIILGIQIGTYAVIDHLAYGLAGSTFIVNVNETKIVEEINKTIVPTIVNKLKDYKINNTK